MQYLEHTWLVESLQIEGGSLTKLYTFQTYERERKRENFFYKFERERKKIIPLFVAYYC